MRDSAGVVVDLGGAQPRKVFGVLLSPLAPKPEQLTFSEASTIPQAAAIALQESPTLSQGSENAGKLDVMRSLGADEVIDYLREDFACGAVPYDRILDLVAHRSSPIARCSPTGERSPALAGIAASAGRCRH